jgi:large subunit ribosomal protein L7/L12
MKSVVQRSYARAVSSTQSPLLVRYSLPYTSRDHGASVPCTALRSFSSPAPNSSSSSASSGDSDFTYPKAEDLFHRIIAHCPTKQDMALLADEVGAILGRTMRENEFYYRGFGIRGSKKSANAAAAAAAAPVAPAAPTQFDVRLVGYDASAKIKVIKEVRALLHLGLKEAKELVESAPKVIEKGLSMEKAQELQQAMVAAGAQMELVPH